MTDQGSVGDEDQSTSFDDQSTALAPVGGDGGVSSRRWRSLWRVHFYSGVFAAPFLILMAITGLMILYLQPLQDLTQGDLRTVTPSGTVQSVDALEQSVEQAYPDQAVTSMVTPIDADHSYGFGLDNGRTVFVNQYTGKVLGDIDPTGDWLYVGRRLHGQLNNTSIKVSLPTVSALWDDGAVMRDYVVGDLVLEVFGVWTLVLMASGIYLWWPRRGASATSRARTGRTLLGIRLGKQGRARWRDLHAVPGLVMFSILTVTLVSGMAWSTYWGANFTALANKISPNTWTDAPASPLGSRGDLERLGNSIEWNTGSIPTPRSFGLPTDGTVAAPLKLSDVVAIAEQEGMKPGYSVSLPDNSTTDDAGNPIYGSFLMSNSWPRKTGEARDVYLNQFTGAKLTEADAYGYGTISYAMDTVVSWHMGTQWGIVTRIFMTMLCVLTIWMVTSAVVMYWKRRRSGTLGLPRRPLDVKLAKRLAIIAVGLGIVYPEWGVTALAVLAIDRFAIRKVPRLRVAFGQR